MLDEGDLAGGGNASSATSSATTGVTASPSTEDAGTSPHNIASPTSPTGKFVATRKDSVNLVPESQFVTPPPTKSEKMTTQETTTATSPAAAAPQYPPDDHPIWNAAIVGNAYQVEKWLLHVDCHQNHHQQQQEDGGNRRMIHIDTRRVKIGDSLLHISAWGGHLTVVHLLFRLNATVDIRGARDGRTPLHLAAFHGHAQVIAFLIEKGADVNARSTDALAQTPLHKAAEYGEPRGVQLLLSRHAEVNAADNNGRTALHTAAWNSSVELMLLLLSCGADANLRDSEGKTPLEVAVTDEVKEILQQPQFKEPQRTTENNRREGSLIFAQSKRIYSALDFAVDESSVLGHGGFATVYAARDIIANTGVAAKRSSKGGAGRMARAHLGDEYEILSQLDHPNIVRVFLLEDHFPKQQQATMFMELLSGRSVWDNVNVGKPGGKPFDETQLRKTVFGVLSALDYLHSTNSVTIGGISTLLHRDIKPANMLLSEEGVVKLSDFSTVKALEKGATSELTIQVVGTDNYYSHEILQDGRHSVGSDIWAVACSAIAMATGRHPWSDRGFQTPEDLRDHIKSAKPPHHHPSIPEHLSVELQEALRRMMSYEAKLRGSAADYLKVFEPRQEQNVEGGSSSVADRAPSSTAGSFASAGGDSFGMTSSTNLTTNSSRTGGSSGSSCNDAYFRMLTGASGSSTFGREAAVGSSQQAPCFPVREREGGGGEEEANLHSGSGLVVSKADSPRNRRDE